MTVKGMRLPTGTLVGLRSRVGIGGRMYPCRIIGVAPNEAIFATPPVEEGRVLPLSVSENVEIVALASLAVFRFVCTVEAVCQVPFGYLVLSRPGVIRRLRAHKSIRARTRLAVRYGIRETGDTYEGLGLAESLSAFGMSLMTSRTLGQPGDRLHVAFWFPSEELDTLIEPDAVIRNVKQGMAPGKTVTHGLELDRLDPAEQMAIRVFVFNHQEDVLHWTQGMK